MTKPKVTTNPVANQYAGPNERIVEYSTRSGLGGLIAFRETDEGLTVDLYRHDPNVEIRLPGLDGVRKAAQAAVNAAVGDSNDTEIEALQNALDTALSALGVAMPEAEEEA